MFFNIDWNNKSLSISAESLIDKLDFLNEGFQYEYVFILSAQKIKCVADLDNFKSSYKISQIVNKASHPIFSEEGLKNYKKNINMQKALFQIFN